VSPNGDEYRIKPLKRLVLNKKEDDFLSYELYEEFLDFGALRHLVRGKSVYVSGEYVASIFNI
jgi:hypothetical protein